ncbi:hypothetical protein [Burkholderia sp. PAMC 28687]|uniref:hypothetical protein n=1 Tax=Burkholderia sp. PAMC 28687 TaxID=1795874 RepID=UPI000AA69046|nr:hypothetical protein [Burkholderia sp. PAMC 28687]
MLSACIPAFLSMNPVKRSRLNAIRCGEGSAMRPDEAWKAKHVRGNKRRVVEGEIERA